MSTLEVSNLNDGTTTVATTFITNGSSKAWCCWKGDGTAAIRDSHNVSSLTDNGAGDYTFAYTSNFGSANYTVAGSFAFSSAITTYVYNVQPRENSVVTTSSVRLLTVFSGASTGLGDYPYAAFETQGDLA
tara:strand:+ start:767 stop:1159 length:393 start_codon:yes stop_codon:yes gene_type:complete